MLWRRALHRHLLGRDDTLRPIKPGLLPIHNCIPPSLVCHLPLRRKLLGRDDTLKPMKPGLHSHKAGRGLAARLPGRVARVAGPLLRLRKSLLYAVATVHSADGQSRGLQVRGS